MSERAGQLPIIWSAMSLAEKGAELRLIELSPSDADRNPATFQLWFVSPAPACEVRPYSKIMTDADAVTLAEKLAAGDKSVTGDELYKTAMRLAVAVLYRHYHYYGLLDGQSFATCTLPERAPPATPEQKAEDRMRASAEANRRRLEQQRMAQGRAAQGAPAADPQEMLL